MKKELSYKGIQCLEVEYHHRNLPFIMYAAIWLILMGTHVIQYNHVSDGIVLLYIISMINIVFLWWKSKRKNGDISCKEKKCITEWYTTDNHTIYVYVRARKLKKLYAFHPGTLYRAHWCQDYTAYILFYNHNNTNTDSHNSYAPEILFCPTNLAYQINQMFLEQLNLQIQTNSITAMIAYLEHYSNQIA